MGDKQRRIPIKGWILAGVVLAAVSLGVAAEFVQPTNLTMSLVELFQVAVAIGLFIWFMNWPLKPTIWDLQKKRRQELMELRGCDPDVEPTDTRADPPLTSN